MVNRWHFSITFLKLSSLLTYCLLFNYHDTMNLQKFLTVFIFAVFAITLAYGRFGVSWQGLFGVFFLGISGRLVYWDFRFYRLPDFWTQLLLWVGLLINWHGEFTSLPSAVMGAVVGYCSFWGIRWVFHAFTHKEGLGLGDCKLLAALGAWLGWQALPLLVLIASLLGLLFSLFWLYGRGKPWQHPVPFGPMLLLAGVWMVFF